MKKVVVDLDLVKFVMCNLVSRDCIPFCKYTKRHVYPRHQGTHDKLNQIQDFLLCAYLNAKSTPK